MVNATTGDTKLKGTAEEGRPLGCVRVGAAQPTGAGTAVIASPHRGAMLGSASLPAPPLPANALSSQAPLPHHKVGLVLLGSPSHTQGC